MKKQITKALVKKKFPDAPADATHYLKPNYMKVGRHGKVFFWNRDEWLLSSHSVTALHPTLTLTQLSLNKIRRRASSVSKAA